MRFACCYIFSKLHLVHDKTKCSFLLLDYLFGFLVCIVNTHHYCTEVSPTKRKNVQASLDRFMKRGHVASFAEMQLVFIS